MHPGSTHTSNLVGLHHEDAVDTDRAVCKGLWKRQQRGRASDSKNSFAGDVNMTAGSGTMEGEAHDTPTEPRSVLRFHVRLQTPLDLAPECFQCVFTAKMIPCGFFFHVF